MCRGSWTGPYWLEAQELEIDEHVRHVTLPQPRSWARFCSEVARHFESPLDFDRPLWEALVITDLDGIEGVPPGGARCSPRRIMSCSMVSRVSSG